MNRIYQWLYKVMNHPLLHRWGIAILPYRLWVILFVHGFMFSLSYLTATLILYEGLISGQILETFYTTVGPLVLIRMAVFWYHDLHQGLWRFVSFQDLLNIIRATIISSILFLVVGALWNPLRIPQSLMLLDTTFCIMFVGGIRFMVRNIRESFLHTQSTLRIKNVLLVGPLGKIQPLVKEFLGNPYSHYLPVAILDPEKIADASMTRLNDIPVFSIRQVLTRSRTFSDLHAIVFCWPEASREDLNDVVEKLKSFQVPFKTVPNIEDILDEKVSISDIRDVEIEDLLERPPVKIDMKEIQSFLAGKTVLVTGGGGSIGAELCRQIASFGPGSLVIVERAENSLYELHVELSSRFPDLPIHATISSINNGPGLRDLFNRMAVDVVFHAAAYKHVPLMEQVPVESAYNNILGTYNVARAAMDAGVGRFVMISTDKAVNPTNVMGATKRIAEMVVQSFGQSDRTRFMTVRFGNVLGSAGSVIPLFKKQILNGEPLTVTDPKIERFFMTIPEAVLLVLQAGCMGKGGEIFVLDMGRSVKILSLAEKLITLSGKRPYEDVKITFTGLRPGEKMYEELFNKGERSIATQHPQITVALSEVVGKTFMQKSVDQIRDIVQKNDIPGLLSKFEDLIPTYRAPLEGRLPGSEDTGKIEKY